MAKLQKAKISDLIQDEANANRGAGEDASDLLRESLEKLGFARSIVVDRENRIIAGNKTQSAAIVNITLPRSLEMRQSGIFRTTKLWAYRSCPESWKCSAGAFRTKSA